MPGVLTSYVEDGITVTFLDGVLHREVPVGDAGTARHFHPNGALQAEVPLKHGRSHGTVRTWHDNGQLASETPCIFGDVIGVCRNWDRDGVLTQDLNHVLPAAIFARNYADVGRVHSVYLWNGKPLSKTRWVTKVLATGMSQSELDQRIASGGPSRVAGAS